jgi:hypothetical protein
MHASPYPSDMQCHYCENEADVAVEKDAVKVGVCQEHFREQLEELEEGEWLSDVDEELDIDRSD